MSEESAHERVLRRLAEDDVYFCRKALKIVTKGGELVPFEPRPAQLRFFAALAEQRAAGLPERVIILKARQLGFSTATQATLIRRTTRRPNHKALVVAHDNDTAGALFEIGERMILHLPEEIRPEIESQRNALGQKYLKFGRKSRTARLAGDVGLNSEIQIDTAKEAAGGRGQTRHSMHLSEVAYWDQIAKLFGLLNSVPDEPGTIVVMESTANGPNAFQEHWRMAVAGESGYLPFFSPWHEEDAYRLAFVDGYAREEFVAQIGKGEYGEDEPRLIEQFALTPEQLAWRRRTIAARCGGSIDRWNEEYPASAEDAFIATGKTVFSKTFIMRVLSRAARTDPLAERGLLLPGPQQRSRLVGGERYDVPVSARWLPADRAPSAAVPQWRVFEHPQQESSVNAERQRLDAGEITLEQFDARVSGLLREGADVVVPRGQYIVFVDAAAGEENTAGRSDWHAIQVIDHRTLQQVAEYHSQVDPDLLAEQALLAGWYWNEALIAVEVTGGWGTPVIKDYLHRRWGYRRLYRRTPAQSVGDQPQQLLGWDTNRKTKPEMIAGLAELLREGTDGIRSLELGRELLTFIRTSDGKTEAAHGAHDDLVMAYMGGQQIARIHPLMTARAGGSARGVATRRPRSSKTGY